MSQGEFSRFVWELASSIPEGRVTTYGILAKAAGGGAMAARSITSILGKSPNWKAIPFHRIVYSDGRAWFSPEYEKKRRALYKREGIEVDEKGRIKDFEEILYRFDE
jgi:methylated-DNA-protein-cysteine methyltransferase related protein